MRYSNTGAGRRPSGGWTVRESAVQKSWEKRSRVVDIFAPLKTTSVSRSNCIFTDNFGTSDENSNPNLARPQSDRSLPTRNAMRQAIMTEYQQQRRVELMRLKIEKLKQLAELNRELSTITKQLDKLNRKNITRSMSSRTLLKPIEQEDSTLSEISELMPQQIPILRDKKASLTDLNKRHALRISLGKRKKHEIATGQLRTLR